MTNFTDLRYRIMFAVVSIKNSDSSVDRKPALADSTNLKG